MVGYVLGWMNNSTDTTELLISGIFFCNQTYVRLNFHGEVKVSNCNIYVNKCTFCTVCHFQKSLSTFRQSGKPQDLKNGLVKDVVRRGSLRESKTHIKDVPGAYCAPALSLVSCLLSLVPCLLYLDDNEEQVKARN